MKNLFFILFAVLISIQLFSQELKENQKDEFTGNLVKRTSWEMIQSNLKFTAYFRISRINDLYYFDLKMMIGSMQCTVFAIDKDQEMMFKFENDSILAIKNLKYEVTCRGCGAKGLSGSDAQGISTSYPLSLSDIDNLRNNIAVKWRIYTTDGYVESDKIRDKYFLIIGALKLVCD